MAFPRVQIGEFELDPAAYELRRLGRPIRLERIPMELLLLLVSRRGELVTRAEIIEKLWGSDVYIDTNTAINVAVRKVRQALRDDPENPRFVQTISGKGYRFIAPNGEVAGSPLPAVVPSPAAAPIALPNISKPAQLRWPLWVALGGLTVIAVLFLKLDFGKPTTSPPGKIMLVVLPFQNLSGDPRQDYFAEGMTEEMITQLGASIRTGWV